MTAAAGGANPTMGGQPLPMVTKLACRNLFHDRLSLVVTQVGIVLSLIVINLSRDCTLPIVTPFNLAPVLLALSVGMCVFGAVSATFKATRIDPAVVFSR